MLKLMSNFLLYPTFEFIEQRGAWIPSIRLPEDYLNLIPKFYGQNRRPEVEDYARTIEKEFLGEELEIKLRWDGIRGLTNISVGMYGSLDLDERGGRWVNFQEHNLGTETSIASGLIAMKYISELLKSE